MAEATEGSGSVLAPDSIVLGGRARSRDDAIDEAGTLLVAAGAVDESYVRSMHERETSVSTYMGNGLAIPHGTNEAKPSIRRTALQMKVPYYTTMAGAAAATQAIAALRTGSLEVAPLQSYNL